MGANLGSSIPKAMAKRPVFHSEIGEFFAELRARKGFTQRQAGALAERRSLPGLTRQILWRLEAGKTKNPEPEVFRAIADLYDEPYEELIGRWVSYRYGVSRDLIGHSQAAGSAAPPLPGGAVDGPAQARVRELEDRLTTYETTLRKVFRAVAPVIAAADERAEDDAAPQPASGGGGNRRKARG